MSSQTSLRSALSGEQVKTTASLSSGSQVVGLRVTESNRRNDEVMVTTTPELESPLHEDTPKQVVGAKSGNKRSGKRGGSVTSGHNDVRASPTGSSKNEMKSPFTAPFPNGSSARRPRVSEVGVLRGRDDGGMLAPAEYKPSQIMGASDGYHSISPSLGGNDAHASPAVVDEEQDEWESLKDKDPYIPMRIKEQDASFDIVDNYDNAECENWSDEIQNLLLFTSLFAATVTAFIVESYQWLDGNPDDTSIHLLTQISLQLANVTNPAQFHNLVLASPLSFQPSPRKPFAIGVNALWFLSLAISLSVVLVGILCLQWLREYQKDSARMAPRDALALRQLRHEGLMAWKVPQIISLLPFLLQVSVVLFVAGLAYLLWGLDRTVAYITLPVLIAIPLALLVTAVAPTLQLAFRINQDWKQCPYKSSQAWWIYRLCRAIFFKVDGLNEHPADQQKASTWIDLDQVWGRRAQAEAQARAEQRAQSEEGRQTGEGDIGQVNVTSYTAKAVLWMMKKLTHHRDICTQLCVILPQLSNEEVIEVARYFSITPEHRDHAEFNILLKLPAASWSTSSFVLHLLERSIRCITRSSRSFSHFLPITAILYVLDQDRFEPELRKIAPQLVDLFRPWGDFYLAHHAGPSAEGCDGPCMDMIRSVLKRIQPITRGHNQVGDAGLDLDGIKLCTRAIKVLQYGYPTWGFDLARSYVQQLSPSLEWVINYKRHYSHLPEWGALLDLTNAIMEVSRGGHSIRWGLFCGVTVGNWPLGGNDSWFPLDDDEVHFMIPVMSELTILELYQWATQLASLSDIPFPIPIDKLPSAADDLGQKATLACLQLAVVSLVDRRLDTDLLYPTFHRRLQQCLVRHSEALSSLIPYKALSYTAARYYTEDLCDAVQGTFSEGLTYGMARTFFISIGVNPAKLWEDDEEKSSQQVDLSAIQDNDIWWNLFKFLANVFPEAIDQSNSFDICLAGLDLVKSAEKSDCAWIERTTREEIVGHSASFAYRIARYQRSGQGFTAFSKSLDDLVDGIQALVSSMDILSIVQEFTKGGWDEILNCLSSEGSDGNDSPT